MKSKETIKAEFAEDGYVFIPGFLSADEVAAISQNFNRVIDEVVPNMPDNRVFYEDKNNPATLKQVMDIHAHDACRTHCFLQSYYRAVRAE